MKGLKIVFLAMVLCLLATAMKADNQGIPFFRNYTAKEYNAHNRNYDIVCDNYGTVFIANFEGLLYFDGASWRKIHTPGISRVTRLAKAPDGRIWLGGFNIFGYLQPDKQGRLAIKTIISDATQGGFGEVNGIKAVGKEIFVHTTNGKGYKVERHKKLVRLPESKLDIFNSADDTVTSVKLASGNIMKCYHSRAHGLTFSAIHSKWGTSQWAPLSEKEGLISNIINNLAYNGGHCLWGATDNGLFCVEAFSPYGQINRNMGLRGEVNCITCGDKIVAIGTTEGLFFMKDNVLHKVDDIDLACWQFDERLDDVVYIATSKGLYKTQNLQASQVTVYNTLSICMDKNDNGYYTGEIDGIYHYSNGGDRKLISSTENVTRLTLEGNDLYAETIYGEEWKISTIDGSEKCLRKQADINTPKVRVTDSFKTHWTTDNNGFNLKAEANAKYYSILNPWLTPLRGKAINAVNVTEDGDIWVGGDFGAIILDAKQARHIKLQKPQSPLIREVVINGDSVLWGGFKENMSPSSTVNGLDIPASCNNIQVFFSTRNISLVSPVKFRYRTNGGQWSAWSEDTKVEFPNTYYGSTKMEIQARDIYGRVSETSMVEWFVEFPVYMRWWAILLYILLITYAIMQFFKWRTKRLENEKQKLEGIVAERTAELSDAYNEQQKMTDQLKEAYSEQQKISAELSVTLEDLKRTQDDLVRMERTATAGKLTQGLIDRILNPINYINNFSKLTSGLAKDLKEDIEDEKENMSEDNYEDCEDILDMMTQNLSKIEEHGVNTTRTLRAMEAMLNTHVGSLVNQDIIPLCRQAVDVTSEYFKNDISRCGISLHTSFPESSVQLAIDAESFNKVLLSTLTNSIYAVVKKYGQGAYPNPEVILSVTVDGANTCIHIRDNGIGIEDTIKEKVFDPFFTTKPTGEAAGVGLYLVREIVNEHGGKISLKSAKGEFCEFTIVMHN